MRRIPRPGSRRVTSAPTRERSGPFLLHLESHPNSAPGAYAWLGGSATWPHPHFGRSSLEAAIHWEESPICPPSRVLPLSAASRRPGDRIYRNKNQMAQEITLDLLGDLRRTHHCGQLRCSDEGRKVVLMGWVYRRRDLGGVIFILLRDREAVTQIVFRAESDAAIHRRAESLRSDFVIAIEGTVEKRSADNINPGIDTGEVEVVAERLRILKSSETPPFPMEEHIDVNEDVRLKYRYVDLRRPHMH